MENKELMPAGENRLPSSFREGAEFLHAGESLVRSLTEFASGTLRSVNELQAVKGRIDVELKRLDNDLQLALETARRDLRLYEMSLPVFSRQLDHIQSRLDAATAKAMELLETSDGSAQSAERQGFMLEILRSTQDSYATVVSKLLSR